MSEHPVVPTDWLAQYLSLPFMSQDFNELHERVLCCGQASVEQAGQAVRDLTGVESREPQPDLLKMSLDALHRHLQRGTVRQSEQDEALLRISMCRDALTQHLRERSRALQVCHQADSALARAVAHLNEAVRQVELELAAPGEAATHSAHRRLLRTEVLPALLASLEIAQAQRLLTVRALEGAQQSKAQCETRCQQASHALGISTTALAVASKASNC